MIGCEKKIKTADSRSVFKKKSNEEQCKAVSKVLDTLEDAKYNLDSENFEAAKSAVDQDISSFLRYVYLYVAI